MSNLSSALNKQWGQLPAWAWFAIAFGALWFYRNKLSPSAATVTQTPVVVPAGDSIYDPNVQTLFGSDGPQQQPQQPDTLQPGESVYDPNTGNLINTPGALLTIGTGANQVAEQGGTSPNLSAAQTAAALPSGGLVTAAATPTATQAGTPSPLPAHSVAQTKS